MCITSKQPDYESNPNPNPTTAERHVGIRKHLKTHLFTHSFPESPVVPVQ